jgi:protein-disulfide isomerase-like protein with CxxC motif
MESVSTFFKAEKDYLYCKGREEKEREVVTNLIAESGLPDEQIAVIAGVPVNFVKIVREGLKK